MNNVNFELNINKYANFTASFTKLNGFLEYKKQTFVTWWVVKSNPIFFPHEYEKKWKLPSDKDISHAIKCIPCRYALSVESNQSFNSKLDLKAFNPTWR